MPKAIPDSVDKSPDGSAAVERPIPSRLFDAVVSTLQEPLVILRGNLTVESANAAFYQQFKVDPEKTINQPLCQLGNGQWDLPELRELLVTLLKQDSVVTGYRVDHESSRLAGVCFC